MKIAMISKAEQIELEALALHHPLSGNVGYYYMAKIRLSGFGTQCCKFGTVKCHYILIFRVFVFERLKQLRRIIGRICHPIAAKKRYAVKFRVFPHR